MKIISLIIPIYNEDQHLLRFVTKLDTLELPIEKELIFIDDNSSDNSNSILNNYKFKSKVIIFQQSTNQGKGSAIKKGIELATGDLRNYLEGKKISWKDGIAAIKHILFFNIIYSKESFFKKEIPEDFLPKDKNWL